VCALHCGCLAHSAALWGHASSSCLHIQQKQIYCRQSNLPYTTHVPHSPAQFCRYGVVGGKRVGWSLNVRDVRVGGSVRGEWRSWSIKRRSEYLLAPRIASFEGTYGAHRSCRLNEIIIIRVDTNRCCCRGHDDPTQPVPTRHSQSLQDLGKRNPCSHFNTVHDLLHWNPKPVRYCIRIHS
jgi:hypothetical protein